MSKGAVRKAVIPAAGLGTRLLPATKSQPKEMLPVGRKPVIQYVVEELASAGIKDIVIVTGRTKRAIEDHFDEDIIWNHLNNASAALLPTAQQLGVKIFYVRQGQPLGLGHAVSLAEQFTDGEPFAVALGDTIIKTKHVGSLLKRLIKVKTERGASVTIAVEKVPEAEVNKYGIIAPVDWQGGTARLKDIIEKPAPHEAPSTFAVASRYIFEPVIYDVLRCTEPGLGGEIQLTDAIRRLIHEGHPVYAVCLEEDEERLDIGNFETYFKAFLQMSLQDEECGETVRAYLRQLLGSGEVS